MTTYASYYIIIFNIKKLNGKEKLINHLIHLNFLYVNKLDYKNQLITLVDKIHLYYLNNHWQLQNKKYNYNKVFVAL